MQLLSLTYSVGTFVLSILVLPVFFCYRRGRAHLWERLGIWRIPQKFKSSSDSRQRLVWFHGASVGEVKGLVPVLKILKEQYPEQAFLVTSTSVTAFTEVEGLADIVRLLPFDSAIWIRAALNDLNVGLFVSGEVEVWPALYNELALQEIPAVIVNGRLSLSSFNAYRRLSFLFRPIFSAVKWALTADQVSCQRFELLGVAPQRVVFTGNAKYDRCPSIAGVGAADGLRASYFSSKDPILVLGSIWPGEEQEWFKSIGYALDNGASLQVVVAPRHGEKNSYFAEKLKAAGLPFRRKTELHRLESGEFDENRIVLLDTIGELESVYSFASAAFIGGSLIDGIGGHNPLEAAAYGTCVSMGPYREVVNEVCNQLELMDALITVSSSAEIQKLVEDAANRSERLRQAGKRGYKVWCQSSGASERIAQVLRDQYQFQEAGVYDGQS